MKFSLVFTQDKTRKVYCFLFNSLEQAKLYSDPVFSEGGNGIVYEDDVEVYSMTYVPSPSVWVVSELKFNEYLPDVIGVYTSLEKAEAKKNTTNGTIFIERVILDK